jgi:RNA polymerase sigma factor (sigma-70 family)
MLSLDQIIKGCKQQKADCQKELYEQFFSLMMGICNRYGTTQEDAEEMLNNGFLKIFVNINQFEKKGSFEGWMRRTMVNSCLDFMRSRQTKIHKLTISPSNFEVSESMFESAMYHQGEFDNLSSESKFDQSAVLELLKLLPEPSRTVFNLSIFEEYTHKEIASMLDMGERTSQWHLSNAKKILADIILKKKQKTNIVGI